MTSDCNSSPALKHTEYERRMNIGTVLAATKRNPTQGGVSLLWSNDKNIDHHFVSGDTVRHNDNVLWHVNWPHYVVRPIKKNTFCTPLSWQEVNAQLLYYTFGGRHDVMPNIQATVSFMPYNKSARVGLLQTRRNAHSRNMSVVSASFSYSHLSASTWYYTSTVRWHVHGGI